MNTQTIIVIAIVAVAVSITLGKLFQTFSNKTENCSSCSDCPLAKEVTGKACGKEELKKKK